MSISKQKIATRRLRRDLMDLKRENLLSIAAHPMDDNIFEWHANIKPNDGVYSGVYFHLILTFPHSYPSKPPQVKIMTPISHPNVFNDWICLSMLREHTSTEPYEGWSGAYSITSILMQLQSFLFADKIDQDEGYKAEARLSASDVRRSIETCKSFRCRKCKHNHREPFPSVRSPAKALIKVYPTRAKYRFIYDGSCCQTTSNYLVGAYGEYGFNYGKVMYEAYIGWLPDDREHYINLGFGTERADICGTDTESFGYSSNGCLLYPEGELEILLPSFSKHDTITCAIDFDNKQTYFAKNGTIVGDESAVFIPEYLQKQQLLFPLLAMKGARVVFNFGVPKKACAYFVQNGFKTLEQMAVEHGEIKKDKQIERSETKIHWHSKYIIDELWVDIFEYLTVQNIFSAQSVCIKWIKLIHKYNIMERGDIRCYFTKMHLDKDQILGIGLNICESEVGYRVILNSQMDILSHNAWINGCRFGVWGEKLTHFLPLAMNKAHANMAHDAIIEAMKSIASTYKSIQTKSYHGAERISHPNALERHMKSSKLGECLLIMDTLITMMNQIVAQFVTGNDETDPDSVSMVLCEKVVLGYCALHHLLLYLRSKNKKTVIKFANKTIEQFMAQPDGSCKHKSRDLGKLLIYLMISKYEWKDIAVLFVLESFTRRTRWFVQNEEYKKYDTTKIIEGRVRDSFASSKTGRRLIMFQVWFMANNAAETLGGYNQRLGRPKQKVRIGIVQKTKDILSTKYFTEYLKELKVSLRNKAAMDQLLRFAVYNSYYRGYHWNKDVHKSKHYMIYKRVNPPKIQVHGQEIKQNIRKYNKQAPSNKKRNKTDYVRNTNSTDMKQKVHKVTVPNKPKRASLIPKVDVVCNKDINENDAKLSKVQRPKQNSVKNTNSTDVKQKLHKVIVANKPKRGPLPNVNTIVRNKDINESKPKLSKAQRRKQRRNKMKSRPKRAPLANNSFVYNKENKKLKIKEDKKMGLRRNHVLKEINENAINQIQPSRAPLACSKVKPLRRSIVESSVNHEKKGKLSKAQRRKLRRKKQQKINA